MNYGAPRLSLARAISLAAVLALPLWGCVGDLPSPAVIDNLRIIGVEANPPEARPGDTVHLAALVVHPGEEAVRLRWYACLLAEPGTGFTGGGGQQAGQSGGGGYGLDDQGDCASDAAVQAGVALYLGEGVSTEVVIPSDFLNADNTRAAYGIGSDVELNPLVLAGLWSIAGVNWTIGLRAELPNGEVRTAYKRINVSTAEPPNANPGNLAFEMRPADAPALTYSENDAPAAPEGRCFTSPPPLTPGNWTIYPQNIPRPAVEYDVLVSGSNPDQLFEILRTYETLFYSYFSTVGTFSDSVTKSTNGESSTWTIPAELPDSWDLWIVVRDGRGGTAWCHETVTRP